MPLLTIGTRGSPLALAQAEEVRRRLQETAKAQEADFPLSIIRTSGDAIQDRALALAGGKGLFTKELDIALLEGRIDIAVHSAKDLPTALPDGLVIAGCLEREDPRDALILRKGSSLDDLPHGGVIGSASLRRSALLRNLRPDVNITLLRGNVGTRLDAVASGRIDATLLALAGLKRLGLADRASGLLPLDTFPPAPGQGAIALMIREGDNHAAQLLAPLLDEATGLALIAERAYLTVLDGSCRTPIAGYASIEGNKMSFHGLVLRPDGSQMHETRLEGLAGQAQSIGLEAGQSIKSRLPEGFFQD